MTLPRLPYPPDPLPDDVLLRRAKNAIVNLGVQLGRQKTVVYLETWLRILKNDHRSESKTMDIMHKEVTDVRSEPDNPTE